MTRLSFAVALFAALALVACDSGTDDKGGAGRGGDAGAPGGGGTDGGGGAAGQDGGGGTAGQDGGGGTAGQDGGGGAAGQDGGGGAAGQDGGAGQSGEAGSGGTSEEGEGIRGAVLGDDGAPLAGAKVAINRDYANTQETDSEGEFSFEEVELPYNLTLVLPSGDLVEFHGLTRRALQLGLFDNDAGFKTAEVSGTVKGIEAFPAGETIGIFAARAGHSSIEVDETTGEFVGRVAWLGGKETEVDLVAARAEVVDGALVYVAAGRLEDVRLEADGTVSSLELDYPTTPIATFDSTVDLDFGVFTSVQMSSWVSIDILGARFEYPQGLPTAQVQDGDTLTFPKEGGRLLFGSTAANGTTMMTTVQVKAAGTTTVHFPDLSAFEATAPMEGASDVDLLPTISWAEATGAKQYWVELVATEGSGGEEPHRLQFFLPGDVTSLDLASIGSENAKLKAGTTYSLLVAAGLSDRALDPNVIATGTGTGAAHIFAMDEYEGLLAKQIEFTTAP